jgi:diacylglycerol kinase family enzyme
MIGISETTEARSATAAAESAAVGEAASGQVEVILNAAAGTGECEAARDLLLRIFAEGGIEARVTLARGGEEIVRLAREAAGDAGTRVVVAGGGDGTINAVASALIGTDKALGVLPFGTLNHFAKDLRIPLDAEGAARTIVSGRAASVDVGEVNGRYFLNNSSLGFYPTLVRERERVQERTGVGKWAAFARALVAVLRRYPFVSVRLDADGRQMRRRTPFVFVGNNRYEFDALGAGRRSRLDAGELCLHATRDVGRIGLFRLALRALLGRLTEDRDFDSLSAREVWVETRRARLRVATDGEVTVMRTPLRYRIVPGALRVMVPRGEGADSGGGEQN